MVEAHEFQKGEKHMLRTIIMIAQKHKTVEGLLGTLNGILEQHDQVFEEEKYLKL